MAERLIIFDLDGTLAYDNVSYAFSKFLYKINHISLAKMLTLVGISLANKYGLCSIEYVHAYAFRTLLEGKNEADIDALITLFLQQSLPTLFRPHLLQSLQNAKNENAGIWLLSSSPACIVQPIAKYLGIKTVLATTYHVKDGVYAGLDVIVTGKLKRAFFEKFIKNNLIGETIAYSDSINDLPLLLAVDTVIAVCPDRKLAKTACEKNWTVYK